MAIDNNRSLLEQQILSNSGLKGKELENLKARLATLSEQQLQAELSKLLSGNNKGEWYTGITLEHSESVVIKSNHETTTFTDENGNEISELRDGNEVFERTIKSTDENGNVYITTVTFQSGKPLTQTKTKNGNTIETTTYRYNDDAEVPYVTVSTKKADHSKVMTNVLEVDENGNFESEDFIDRQATTVDGTTTHIFTENNCVIEQQVKPNGKKVDTLYKGDNIEDYDNKKLHRVYQRTELNGEVHEVAYDGNGNTRTVVQNGESPSAIAKKFGVKESSLLKLNPTRGKNAITQVGADIVVPGEYNADSRIMKTRKTKQGAMQDYANDEVQRTAERLYSSTMQEVTIDKDYKDAYSYARALLAADGVKNPSNQQVNNKANEILVANGNIKFKKGTKVQIAAKAPDSKFVQDLSNNGFKPTRENAIFYNRFNALNSQQQQNVLSVIKYCRSQKITDPNKIKAKILETFPEINLFDSGKVIPMNSSFGTPVFQRKNPVALETFLTDTLKLDLKSETGKMVYERLSSLPQDELNKIDGHNFADMSKANFNEIANSFETSGVNIRTGIENQMEQNTRVQRAERLGIPQQKFTSEILANIYDNAADMLEQYYHNHGVFDAGTYLEGYKNLMDWITPDNLFGIDMRSTLHVASDCRKAAQRFRQMHTDNPETFKREYEQLKKEGLVTADYNQQNVQEFMNLIQSGDVNINSDKFKNACQKAFGFKGVENTEKYIQTGEMAGNIGDIVIMLYTLGAASELKMMGKATTGVYGALERGAGKIMGKTAAQKTAKVGTSMLMGGTTLGGFTLGKETLNNLSNPMRDATSWETWKETGIASAESFGFGFVGGLLNETVVAPIVKAIEKPATKATQAVSKALTEQGELTGKQIMETVSESGSLKLDGLFKMNSQELANMARTATAKGVGFGVEVTGFTAYEAGLDVIKDLIDPNTGRLPENMTVESLTEYLGEKFGEQFSNLGTIKGVSQLLMMSKGGKIAQKAMMNEILSKSEALKDLKFKKAEINGHEVYEVTYPNGNRAVVSSPEQAISTCQMAMQMEFLAKSLTDGEHKSEITRPQGMNAEDDALIQKTRKENPAMILDETPQVKKLEATEGVPKENMKTSSVEHTTHESMSDAEFESLKLQLLENPNFPKSEDKSGYFRHKKFTRIDKDNILYAKNLLENSELSNLLGERTLSRLINNFGTDKNEASRILLQELQNTPDFFKNPNIEDGAVDNILSRTNSDKVQTQILLLQKLKNNPDLLKNSYISEKICDILSGVNSVKSLELVDKLFSKPERLENLINIDKILSVADNDYSISFAEKILEKPELFLAPDFVVFLPDLIKKCDSDITNNTKLELFNEFIKNSQNISDTELTNAFARAMHIGNNKVFDLRNKDNKLSSSELKTLELNSEKSLSSDLYENLFLELSKNEKFKDLSSKYYDLYLENEFKECSREDATRYREMCKSIDKEYGVKIILPANLKEVGQSLILVYQELNNYKMHSNNQAKMPPVLDFMYPLAYNAAGMAHIRDGINQIDVRELSTSFIKHSLRHEMAHINDSKQMDKFPTEIRTFKNEPKKEAWGGLGFDVHSDLDINNCKYVDELRKGGISQKLIEYAYTNPMEFVAVASQGDFSKYSPEFKKYLTELGMPEWMLSFSNPKPYFISRENKSTKADEVNISEQSQRPNANNSNPAMIIEQSEHNVKTIDVADAKAKLQEFTSEENDNYIGMIIQRCSMNNQVSEVLLNEAISLLKSGVDSYDVSIIVYGFKVNGKAIDYNRIKKFHDLINKGTNAKDASDLLGYSRDKNGLYSEDLYNKIMSLDVQDYDASRVLDACKIDGEVVESTWQKALELNSVGFKNDDIKNVLKSCRIKESEARTAKTIGFNDEAYSKAKLLFEEHKFESENISRIIERCTVDGKFSQECFDRAVSLHGKISESNIYDFVRYPNELLDFMLEIKDKYNIKEYKLDYILRECVSTVDGKTVASPICMSKAEELIAKYNFKADDVGHLLYASKVDGELDLKLYEEVIKMHQAGFNRIGSIIESLTTKGQNEGETSQVNYDLLQKTKEWKELGIEDDWISQYCSEFEGLKIDVNKHDLVREYHNAGFKPHEIRNLLEANGNLENLSLTEFQNKVFELKELGLETDNIVNLLNSIGMPTGWNTPKFKLSKQNFDMVTDMVKRGIKDPARIVYSSYENHAINQDILNTAYERIKDGISEDRLSCLNSMRRYFTEMPELEDVLINLSKTVREDYDYNSFYSLANNVYNEMYNSKSGKDVANNVIEALKKGAKEEDIKYILDTNYGDPVRINRDNLDKSEVISQIKTKLLNALVEHPENTEQIKTVARTIVDGDLSRLDFYLKYPDKYADILRTEHPLDWMGNRLNEFSNRARKLMLQLDTAGVQIDDILKYTDILCKGTSNLHEPIPENIVNKIIELIKNQKLDDNILKMISHLPFTDKTPELIDYVMELKEKNLLPEFNEQNEYDISALIRILPKNSETGKLGLYENYKEILDFYVKNKDVLRYERVNGENHYITEFVDIVRNYNEHHSGIDKAMDLEPFKAMAEIVRKTSISPETINGIISNGYADKLKAFTDKVDLEKYSNELNLIFKQLNEYYNHSSYSDILNENISKRDLEYLLDMQKLMCENVKENETPQILDNSWFRRFIGEKEIPAEALDKLRYYIEMELADPNKHGRYISIDRYHNTVRLYENSPENIERIESIMYNKGFEDGMYEHILNDLSSNPEILNKQLELIENILDFTGDLSGNKSYLQSDIISILRDAKTLEDVNVKIELWEQLKTPLQSKSTIQKFWDANIKKQNNLGMALMCVEGTNNTNKNAVLAAMGNKKYSNLIWNCARNINKNNVALIEDIIKNDRLNDPDNANFAGIVLNTSINEFKAKFVQENFDIIPQEDLSKATSILSEINGNLIVRLYNDKELNFPKEHILDIAPYCNQMNIDLVTQLCTDKNLKFPADQIKDIARAINLTNNELAEKLCTDKSLKCPTDKIVDILKAFELINVDTKSLSLSEKINTLGTISSMDKTLLTLCRKYSPVDIDAKIAELTVLLGKKKDVINISASQQRMFVQNILANNNQNAETVLKNFDFQQYGKQGLPLTYTRKQFADNIENLIKELSTEEQQVVLEHFGLIKGETGFDGLPTNRPFNNENVSPQVNEIAKKVQNEIEIFTARNKINTGDIVVDNVLNGLINGLPEFTSIVGKEQHGTHAYSVDIHTLKVLQSAMNNPLYERLTDRDKTILKIAALCHDLGKRGGVVDTGHASSSAEYVTAILDKFPFPQGMKDRIIDIVDNHHWFEAYNTGHATAEDVAVRCRRPEDFMIYEILAKADFENVNKNFHIERSNGVSNQADFDKFMQERMQAIDDALTTMYSRSNLVFDTQFVQNGDMFPRQTIELDGVSTELKVLNLNDLKNSDDLQKYGFSTGVTKDNARFTVHMTAPTTGAMESVMILTQNSLNQSAWSTSLIKASNNRTYESRKFGFILDVDQANISEANYSNTRSGCGKGLETFKTILFEAHGSARTYVRDNLLKELSKNGIKLNDKEYAQLVKYLITKKYTTQITKDIKIGDQIIKAETLVKALETSRDALFKGGDIHSEIVPINPRVKGLVAKVEKLEDCPTEFLNFAKTHNLPIILMKATKDNTTW